MVTTSVDGSSSASVRSGSFLSLFLGARRAATPAPSAPSAGADVITPPGVTSVLLRPTDPCNVQKWLEDEEVDVACRGELARELAAVEVVAVSVVRGAAVGVACGGGASASPPGGAVPGGLAARGYPQARPPPACAPPGGSASDSSSRGPTVMAIGGSHWRMLAPCVAQNLPRPPAGLPRPLAIPAALPLSPNLPPAAW